MREQVFHVLVKARFFGVDNKVARTYQFGWHALIVSAHKPVGSPS
jgi:hypothetical protein